MGGLIPNLQRILQQSNGAVDINCVLHIRDGEAQRADTLKTLQIARMFAKETQKDSIECFEVEETMKKDFADKLKVKSKRIEALELKVSEMEGEIAQLRRSVRKGSKSHVVSCAESTDLSEDEPLLKHRRKNSRRRDDMEGNTCSFTCTGCCLL